MALKRNPKFDPLKPSQGGNLPFLDNGRPSTGMMPGFIDKNILEAARKKAKAKPRASITKNVREKSTSKGPGKFTAGGRDPLEDLIQSTFESKSRTRDLDARIKAERDQFILDTKNKELGKRRTEGTTPVPESVPSKRPGSISRPTLESLTKKTETERETTARTAASKTQKKINEFRANLLKGGKMLGIRRGGGGPRGSEIKRTVELSSDPEIAEIQESIEQMRGGTGNRGEFDKAQKKLEELLDKKVSESPFAEQFKTEQEELSSAEEEREGIRAGEAKLKRGLFSGDFTGLENIVFNPDMEAKKARKIKAADTLRDAQAETDKEELDELNAKLSENRGKIERRLKNAAAGALTKEGGAKFLSDKLSVLDSAEGRARTKLTNKQSNRSLELERKMREDPDFKSFIDLQNSFLKGGGVADTSAKLLEQEKFLFLQNFIANDRGDPLTKVSRGLAEFQQASKVGATPKEAVVFRDIDAVVFGEGFDLEQTLETAVSKFDGDVSKARKYMKSREFPDKQITEQIKSYQKDVLGFTDEEIEEENADSNVGDIIRKVAEGGEVTANELDKLQEFQATNPKRAARWRERIANPDATEAEIWAIVERQFEAVKPKKAGAAKGLSTGDVATIDEFFQRNPEVTLSDVVEGFSSTGEEDKVPTGSKVREEVKSRILERDKQEAEDSVRNSLNEEEAEEAVLQMNEEAATLPEEERKGFFQGISDFFQNSKELGNVPRDPDIVETPAKSTDNFDRLFEQALQATR